MKKTYLLSVISLFVVVLSMAFILKSSIMRGTVDDSLIFKDVIEEEWTKVYLETWIPNKTANHKNTALRAMNNYTVVVYNITVTLGEKTWEYWDSGHELYELEPGKHEWFYYIVPDEQRVANAYGWIKNG